MEASYRQACAIAVDQHLNRIGHTGPRVLIHADLGSVEWKESLPCCERLAEKLGWELQVERRAAGGLMQRWQGRWANNVRRYADLSCVKLILPWSTPAMRFCTSELKSAVIMSALKKRFPRQEILNVTGIRRQESAARSRAAVSVQEAKLSRKGVTGYSWNAIIEWQIGQVFSSIAEFGLALHEAYTRYNCSRDIYVEMVELEADSTFGLQGSRWLADVAPHLLSEQLLDRVARAKVAAAARQAAEQRIPKHLYYAKGWPTCMPTREEAELLASVRRDVAAAIGLTVQYTTADSVLERYAHLMTLKKQKEESTK